VAYGFSARHYLCADDKYLKPDNRYIIDVNDFSKFGKNPVKNNQNIQKNRLNHPRFDINFSFYEHGRSIWHLIYAKLKKRKSSIPQRKNMIYRPWTIYQIR